jgi:phosphohistidine phosphatase SixA
VSKRVLRGVSAVLVAGVFAAGRVEGQTVRPDDLVNQLRQGGYVLVMRHASSPQQVPSKETANRDNTRLERQLDEAGRRGAAAMGEAIRALKIPIGTVLTSPTYRALETVRHAGFTSPIVAEELGDRGKSMQGVDESQAAWLRKKAAEVPASGNTLLVTHQPNLSRAFTDWGATVGDGEVAVLRPDGRGGATLAGRIPIAEWPTLTNAGRP